MEDNIINISRDEGKVHFELRGPWEEVCRFLRSPFILAFQEEGSKHQKATSPQLKESRDFTEGQKPKPEPQLPESALPGSRAAGIAETKESSLSGKKKGKSYAYEAASLNLSTEQQKEMYQFYHRYRDDAKSCINYLLLLIYWARHEGGRPVVDRKTLCAMRTIVGEKRKFNIPSCIKNMIARNETIEAVQKGEYRITNKGEHTVLEIMASHVEEN